MINSSIAEMASRTKDRIGRGITGLPEWARWSMTAYPPGHYHSPLPDLTAAHREGPPDCPEQIAGIDTRLDEQLKLADEFASMYDRMPFGEQPQQERRYWLGCRWFAHGDGVALYSMLRHVQPKRYVEIGSGFSSACALDTADWFMPNLQMRFYEPNPGRLYHLLRDMDLTEVITSPPEHYRPEHFADLEAGDILFIDSSHVVKHGSEVNDLLLDVVPQLPAGVFIHVHDIFWPFTYPLSWIRRGWAWNEGYLLRGLLCGNPSLRIVWFNNYLGQVAKTEVGDRMPSWAADPGSSIWLERV